MLKLRRGTVREAASSDSPEQALTVELDDGGLRPAIADVGLVGRCEQGDKVLVNVEAYDLGLGSGGFDVVHANLTRGLGHGDGVNGDGDGGGGARGSAGGDSGHTGAPRAHVMKLNYSSLQHAVLPVEERDAQDGLDEELRRPLREDSWQSPSRMSLGVPVAILALHGQLGPLAWAFAKEAEPGRRLGFVQTPGGALSGSHSRVVRQLRAKGLLAGHITAGACYGGGQEAMSTAGALYHAARSEGWDAIVCGPGPGIVGSGSVLGHGGMQALDSAHASLALGAHTLIVPRMSSADPRPRHRGISHHTVTVLELLLQGVMVALPEAPRLDEVDDDGALPNGWQRHEWSHVPVDLAGYAASGLPTETMGRSLEQDPLFFASSLAGGEMLARLLPWADRAGDALSID